MTIAEALKVINEGLYLGNRATAEDKADAHAVLFNATRPGGAARSTSSRIIVSLSNTGGELDRLVLYPGAFPEDDTSATITEAVQRLIKHGVAIGDTITVREVD